MRKEQVINQIVMNKDGKEFVVVDAVVNGHGVIEQIKCKDASGKITSYGGTYEGKWLYPFELGFVSFKDKATQQAYLDEKRIRDEEEEEARKIAADNFKRECDDYQSSHPVVEQKSEKPVNRNHGKESGPIRPYLENRRKLNKPCIFLVCQNDTYDTESKNGYIWAPLNDQPGDTDYAYHAELDLVKEGDIIFHHFGNVLHAISIAKGPRIKSEPIGRKDKVGRLVKCSYQFLDNPVDTKGLKDEKIKYDSNRKYSPFEVTGKNKEGFYLSELSDELANIFIDEAIAANPGDKDLLVIKSQL